MTAIQGSIVSIHIAYCLYGLRGDIQWVVPDHGLGS